MITLKVKLFFRNIIVQNAAVSIVSSRNPDLSKICQQDKIQAYHFYFFGGDGGLFSDTCFPHAVDF